MPERRTVEMTEADVECIARMHNIARVRGQIRAADLRKGMTRAHDRGAFLHYTRGGRRVYRVWHTSAMEGASDAAVLVNNYTASVANAWLMSIARTK